MAKKLKLTKAQDAFLLAVLSHGYAIVTPKGYYIGGKRYALVTGEALYALEMIDVAPGRRDHRILSEAAYDYRRTAR